MPTILITGAAGNVAALLRPGLTDANLRPSGAPDSRGADTRDQISARSAGARGLISLRVADTREPVGWGAAEVMVGDLTDPAFAAQTVDGVDAVIHLAASPLSNAPFADLLSPNVIMTATILDAAAAAGVRKVVLASSVHALGAYAPTGNAAAPGDPETVRRGNRAGRAVAPGGPGDVRGEGNWVGGVVIDPSWPVRPCCRYGATKAFAEAYGSVVAATSDTAVICLRLGLCLPRPTTTGNLPEWLAPQDLQQLVRAALATDVRYGVYFGVSANTRHRFDHTNDLGYEPTHDAEVYATQVREGPSGLCDLPGRA